MRGTEMFFMLLFTTFFWGWVVWAILEWRKLKYKKDLQNKIVEKFNTVPELNDFLQTNGGSKFLSFLSINGQGPEQKLLSAITKGVILFIVGIALFFIGPFLMELTTETRIFQALGILTIALGIGFLVSTAISYHLSKKWGIMDTEKK